MSDSASGRRGEGATAARGGREALVVALERIQQPGRGYRFTLLRETPLNADALDAGDIDLLGDRRGVYALLTHLDELCRELAINLLVERTGPRKTRASLYTRDLQHTLHFDLWTDLWQLADGRRSLRWSDVSWLCQGDGSFVRMPAQIEVAVYLEHLRAKRKLLSSAGVRARLEHYARVLGAEGDPHDGLGDALAAMAAEPPAALPEAVLNRAAEILGLALGKGRPWTAVWRRSQDALRRRWARRMAPPPGVRVVALVGPDGIGKSTVAKALVAEGAGWDEYVLGKSLYRRSAIFRALYKLNRIAGARLSQESIDEALAALAYLTTLVRLRRRLASSTGRGLVIDRSLADFLYVGRKADRSRFSRWTRLVSAFYVSLPIVQLTAPHAVLSTRKQEISAAGLARYDRDMTRFYARRPRVRYLRFENAGSPEEAIRSLSGYLARFAAGEET